ncbi:MAG TPA: DUF6339 family protein [Polyangium sp.]|nr:DUF6339 family protein [Polyangium sp.]
MIYRLLPQLPNTTAQALATEYGSAIVEDLRLRATNHHPQQVFSPTGGQQVSRAELDEVAVTIRQICNDSTPATVDAKLTRILHPWLRITRFEAALDGVWSFLGCVLLPDIARWRFGGPITPSDRFVGTGRGVRNMFGRAWWRGELFYDVTPPPGRDSYWLVDELGEDELTGIVERQRAVSSQRVAVALARALVETDCKGIPRTHVARDALKVFLRLGYFVEFDALTNDEIEIACQSLFRRSVKALQAREERPV